MKFNVRVVTIILVQHRTHAVMHSLTMANQQVIFDLVGRHEIELQELVEHYEAKQLRTVLEVVSLSVIDPLGLEHRLEKVPRSFSVSSDSWFLVDVECTCLNIMIRSLETSF